MATPLPSDEEVLEVAAEAAETFGMPPEMEALFGGIGLAVMDILKSDCQCDGCSAIRGAMAGMEEFFANQS